MRAGTFLAAAALAAFAGGGLHAQDATFSLERLTLDKAIRLALAQNPQVKVESYETSIARANLLAQWGAFDPALQFQRQAQSSYQNNGAQFVADGSGGLVQLGPPQFNNLLIQTYQLGIGGTTPWGLQYTVGGNSQSLVQNFGGHTFPEGYQSFGGVNVTQPLLRGFGFGSNLQGVRVARANKGIAEWTYRQSLIDTVTNVIGAYSDVEFARDNLRIAQESKQLSAVLLSDNERRFKIGTMSQSDVIQARSQEGLSEEPILFAQRALIDSENALRAVLGQQRFSPDAQDMQIEPMPDREEVIAPEADLQKAYDLRPDYQSARLGIKKFAANQSAALNGLLPQVNFVGGFGYNGLANTFQASRQMVYDHDNQSYSAGLVVSIPLSFTQGRAQYRSARLQRMQAEANLKVLEQTVALDVSVAAGQVETTRERIKIARQAYAVGQLAVDAEQKKLRAGSSSTFVVLQLQQQMISLEQNVAKAESDHRRALAEYDHEIGTTLQRNDVTLAPD